MKAHHMKMRMRHHKAGGGAESPREGVREYEQDLHDHPKRYNQSHVEDEAEAMRRGGHVAAHKMHPKHHKKHVAMHGKHAAHHAGRKPRKSGGRAGSNMNPLSSAHAGTPAKGRHTVGID